MNMTRRTTLAGLTALGATSFSKHALAVPGGHLKKSIPATGEMIPAIGMGSWLTFSVPDEPAVLQDREAVLRAFFDASGGMIDSSPMYGRSEAVIGQLLQRLDHPKAAFTASKIWTPVGNNGPVQFDNTATLWQAAKKDRWI